MSSCFFRFHPLFILFPNLTEIFWKTSIEHLIFGFEYLKCGAVQHTTSVDLLGYVWFKSIYYYLLQICPVYFTIDLDKPNRFSNKDCFVFDCNIFGVKNKQHSQAVHKETVSHNPHTVWIFFLLKVSSTSLICKLDKASAHIDMFTYTNINQHSFWQYCNRGGSSFYVRWGFTSSKVGVHIRGRGHAPWKKLIFGKNRVHFL